MNTKVVSVLLLLLTFSNCITKYDFNVCRI